MHDLLNFLLSIIPWMNPHIQVTRRWMRFQNTPCIRYNYYGQSIAKILSLFLNCWPHCCRMVHLNPGTVTLFFVPGHFGSVWSIISERVLSNFSPTAARFLGLIRRKIAPQWFVVLSIIPALHFWRVITLSWVSMSRWEWPHHLSPAQTPKWALIVSADEF